MSVTPTLLSDALRDFEREQAILAIGHRMATVRMTERWREFLLQAIGEDGSVDAAWRIVCGECMRYLVNARAITGQGLTIPDIASWVASLAERHGVPDMTQQVLEQLSRDIIIAGFMASGEEVKTYSMRAGTLTPDHAPAIIEEREAGVYQPTLEAMDFAFRNLDYERAYDHAFHVKDIMLERQVSSGNYVEATDQVRSLRRSLAMVAAEYQRMMDGGMRDLSVEDLRAELESLATQMENISSSNDLDRISDRLSALASVETNDWSGDALISARTSLRHLMVQVSDAKADLHEVMSLRPKAEASLEERLAQGLAVRSQGRMVDLERIITATIEGRLEIDDVVDMLLVMTSEPRPMGRIAGWGTLLASLTEIEEGPRGGGLDLTTLTDVVDDVKLKTEDAKASMGASLEAALASEEAKEEGLPVMDWLSNATDDERFLWMDTGVLVAFLHALHVGTEHAQASGGGWRDWIGGALEDTEIALTRDSDGSNSIDAINVEEAQRWELEFEGRRIIHADR